MTKNKRKKMQSNLCLFCREKKKPKGASQYATSPAGSTYQFENIFKSNNVIINGKLTIVQKQKAYLKFKHILHKIS